MAGSHLIQGKVVVVTGANRGIGLALVGQLLGQNNTVIATARQPQAATALHDLAASSSGRLHITQLDTASTDSIADWAQEVKKLAQHLDVVINNAGVLLNPAASLLEATPESMIQEYQINALGPFFVTQQLHKAGLIGGAHPTLVAHISSLIASIGNSSFVWQGMYGYRASKAGLNMLNKLLVQDLTDHNVELLVLHPGYVDTDMSQHQGVISTAESASGMLKVLQSGQKLNGRFLGYDGSEIVW